MLEERYDVRRSWEQGGCIDSVVNMGGIVVCGVLVRSGVFLLAKRSSSRTQYPGVWDAAGGHSEDGETPDQTLVRELGEELGIVPTRYRLVTVIPAPEPALNGELPCHIYCVTAWDGEPLNLAPDEHDQLGWFGPDDIDQLKLPLPSSADTLRLALSMAADMPGVVPRSHPVS